MVAQQYRLARCLRLPDMLLVMAGATLLFAAAPLALLMYGVAERFPHRPETGIQLIGALFGILLILPGAIYLLARRNAARPWSLGFIVIAALLVCLLASYFYSVSSLILYPADILIWSESEFVNDILKLRAHYPLYSAQQNNESFVYVPGSQILTYIIALLVGHPISIPVYRIIQLGYVLIAAAIAALCCLEVARLATASRSVARPMPLYAVLLPACFLVATNSLTNPFSHNLHNDALALLVSALAFWLLLRYAASRDWQLLAAMAALVPLGSLVKQSLLVWLVLYAGHLALFDRPRSLRRLTLFLVGSLAGLGVAFGGCYALWGNDFTYWTITVLGQDEISLLRSLEHVLEAWPYLAIGLLGGMVLLRGQAFRILLGPWLVWLALMLAEAYSSGIAWMLNHLGPGSLLGSVWFFAALIWLWQRFGATQRGPARAESWVHAFLTVGVAALLCSGLGLVRIPWQPIGQDAYRYLAEIEQEFADTSTGRVLLDVGTWIYLREGLVMKDRAVSFGDRGANGTGDFSGFLARLDAQEYEKILVRNLHSPDFWYDHSLWPRASGVRERLLERYSEVRRIAPVAGTQPRWSPPYGMATISVLVPRPLAAGGGVGTDGGLQ